MSSDVSGDNSTAVFHKDSASLLREISLAKKGVSRRPSRSRSTVGDGAALSSWAALPLCSYKPSHHLGLSWDFLNFRKLESLCWFNYFYFHRFPVVIGCDTMHEYTLNVSSVLLQEAEHDELLARRRRRVNHCMCTYHSHLWMKRVFRPSRRNNALLVPCCHLIIRCMAYDDYSFQILIYMYTYVFLSAVRILLSTT